MCKHSDWAGCGYCVADNEHQEVLVLHDKVESLEAEVERLRELVERAAGEIEWCGDEEGAECIRSALRGEAEDD